ncbi:MAG: class I SAM-dependent methyltransferase [Desulfobacterium sp.]|jgi:SAM-dependent methyltransferase|nr:class I SAM-dependent methyltransferase [Desulfobacterium sp.]
MQEFWESKFKDEGISWGFEPSNSALLATDFFLKQQAKDILIPGIGYGRNASVFLENGMSVTGIEISKTAIDIARNELGLDILIFHGSVTEMPYDKKQYDGIFCYALIQLLDGNQRKKFIEDCYNQLRPDGTMMFTVPSKESILYKKGLLLSEDRYQLMDGLSVYFYDSESIVREFKDYGLIDYMKINEPPLKCLLIRCKRNP